MRRSYSGPAYGTRPVLFCRCVRSRTGGQKLAAFFPVDEVKTHRPSAMPGSLGWKSQLAVLHGTVDETCSLAIERSPRP